MERTKQILKSFVRKYGPQVKELGYLMSHAVMLGKPGPNDYYLSIRLHPADASHDPISDSLLKRIKNEVLPKEYRDVLVEVIYRGAVKALEKKTR